jgi:hypothetical protein
MTVFSRRGDGLERALRAARPEPRKELVLAIEGRVRAARPRRATFRVAVPAALTAAMVAALASVGGMGYAASQVQHAVTAVQHVLSPAGRRGIVMIGAANAGGDQYQPGFGWGDPNHTHSGPPGVTRAGGAFAPPLQANTVNGTAYLKTAVTLDEQAHLTISVVDPATGAKLQLVQNKSSVGSGIKGPSTKNVQYLVLVPRTIPLKLAIPRNLLEPGKRYVITITAKSPSGEVKTLTIPFVA